MFIEKNTESVNKLNVLHLSRTMDQGGAEKIVYQLASGIHKKGARVVVASCGGVYEGLLKEQNIPHYQIADMECKNIVTMVRTVKMLIKIVRDEHIDIIHTHHRMAALYAYMLKICFPKIKLIYTAHNVFFDKKVLTWLALSRCRIIAVGKSVKMNLAYVFHINPKRVEIIYNAVQQENMDERDFHPELKKLKMQGYILVGTIGRLSEQKGMDVFIRALQMIKQERADVKGVIIGDGVDKEKLQNLISELGMEADIFMLGYQEHVRTLLSQLDLVVMASRWEGFPLTPIEVFSAGKTLVASNIGGINEIVKHKQNGLLVSKDQVEEFYSAIKSLIENQELRRQLENNGKKCYENYFNYESFLTHYYEIYQKLLEEDEK